MKDVNQYTCYSGGANGADLYFELFSKQFHVNVVAYSYKTKYHVSENKQELTYNEFNEGVMHVYKANETLKRSKINPYLRLLARNWFQVKSADEVFAIAVLRKNQDGYRIKGGTAWAVQMAIDVGKNVFVFDQEQIQWFYWDIYFRSFLICKEGPKISAFNFAGIGTRNINLFGIDAIEQLYINTFK